MPATKLLNFYVTVTVAGLVPLMVQPDGLDSVIVGDPALANVTVKLARYLFGRKETFPLWPSDDAQCTVRVPLF